MAAVPLAVAAAEDSPLSTDAPAPTPGADIDAVPMTSLSPSVMATASDRPSAFAVSFASDGFDDGFDDGPQSLSGSCQSDDGRCRDCLAATTASCGAAERERLAFDPGNDGPAQSLLAFEL